MARLAPPKPPLRVKLGDDDSLRRLRFRLWQILVTTLTGLLTAWCCTLDLVLGIIALAVAKHVLVAILVMGLDIYPQYKGESGMEATG